MKIGKYILQMLAILLTAGMAVACSTEEDQWGASSNDRGILFTASSSSSGSRAVDLTNDVVKSSGCGVFAYNQGSADWATYSQTTMTPEYMNNVKVEWSPESSSWTYSGQKAWRGSSKLSFFSYAPYESTLSTTAATTSGVKLVLDKQYGGPALEYTLPESDLSKTEDLCYADPSNLIDQTENTVTDYTVPLKFLHATCKNTFKVLVENKINSATQETLTENQPLDDHTTIKIQKVELVGTLPSTGILSLGTGSWTTAATDEHTMTLGSDLFQTDIKDGITGSEAIAEVSLLASTNGDAITLIPAGTYKLKVTYQVIVYQVAITKETTVDATYTPEKGKSFTFVMKFKPTGTLSGTFTVNDWGDVTYTIPEGNYDYCLANVQFTVADWNNVSYEVTEEWAATTTNWIDVEYSTEEGEYSNH